tara:strand:+ start:47 stop:1597 length:1551 start_codon:yes stop_codon:yes gene_type:complete
MKDHLLKEDFYNIKLFDSIKNECTSREIKKAYELVEDEVFEKKEEINDLENKLLNLSKTCQDGTQPLLSLRCRVSNLLFKSINYRFQKIDFKKKPVGFYSQLKGELFPNSLQDKGQTFLKLNFSKDLEIKIKKEFKDTFSKNRVPINWRLKEIKDQIDKFNNEFIKDKEEKFKNFESVKLPLGIEIVFDFNNKLAGLAHWVDIKFKTNKRIKEILDDYGIDSASIWSKLATYSVLKLKKAWKIRLNEELPSELESLLKSYKIEYPLAKKIYNKKNKRTYGWIPDENFLRSLNPPQKDYEKLRIINKVYSLFEKDIIKPLKNNNSESDSSSKFINLDVIRVKDFIFKILEEDLQEIVNKKFYKMQDDFLKNPWEKLIWKFYSEGLNQRKIAVLVDKSQTTIFRVLKKVEPFIKDVSIEILPSFEKKLNFLNKNKNYPINNSIEFYIKDSLDKEYYEDITKEFLEKVRNIRNDISLIDSFNIYFFQLLNGPLQNDEIRNKKDSITYFQKLVNNYFKHE